MYINRNECKIEIKCILLVNTKFESLKLIYLISNCRKEIYINRNECKIEIKCILLVNTKFESLKLIYLISNYRK